MPYYKLPHTDGVVMFFPRGRSDLEPADPPEESEGAAPKESKPRPKRSSRRDKANRSEESKGA